MLTDERRERLERCADMLQRDHPFSRYPDDIRSILAERAALLAVVDAVVTWADAWEHAESDVEYGQARTTLLAAVRAYQAAPGGAGE